MDKTTNDILDINLARRIAELSQELDREEYKDLFSYDLPTDDDNFTEEDEEIMDCLDFNKDSMSPDARHVYFDHQDNDSQKPITGITVTDGLGNVLIDKDFENPIDVKLDDLNKEEN